MDYIPRRLETLIKDTLEHKKSILLLGARQTGKTTLIKQLPSDRYITLSDIRIRQAYETNPGQFIGEIEHLSETTPYPLVILDEIQKVPELMDAVQYLIDEKKAQFILTGSSVRKINNFLPGRVIVYQQDPFTWTEIPNSLAHLTTILTYGSLPEVLTETDTFQKESLLRHYTETFLEEEIRKEAIVRGIGAFRRFLELSALESGKLINLSKLSQDVGVAHTTISSYYTILEECRLVERVEPFLFKTSRKRLSKSQKFLLFDLGVKRIAAKEGPPQTDTQFGPLFEQFIGLEIKRLSRLYNIPLQLKYWRDLAGPEVDWIVETPTTSIPIEVKWTASPSRSDARHLSLFLKHQPHINQGYIVCQTQTPYKITDTITAVPWTQLQEILLSL